nr:hypothetical protein [Tanacetum cinerariifolium]
LGEIKLLPVALDSQLKVEEFLLDQEKQHVFNITQIDNLTHEILVGPAFNLLKGTCKSFVELKYHFEECYKTVIDQLDWNNHEGHEYPFDLNKPLPLIEAQGRQVVTSDYFFNQ